MTSKFVGKENNVVSFTISFTAEEFEEGLVKGSITIDGFRKGKAPRTIIERKYGETVFFEDAIDIMLNEAYPKALDELKVEPISSPKIDFGKDKISIYFYMATIVSSGTMAMAIASFVPTLRLFGIGIILFMLSDFDIILHKYVFPKNKWVHRLNSALYFTGMLLIVLNIAMLTL